MKNSDILVRNNIFYEFLIHRKLHGVKEDISAEEMVKRISFLAKFAWRNHAGYYFDGRLENRLLDYGRALDEYIDQESMARLMSEIFPEEENFTILHVATELGAAGGHTRVLYQLLKRYQDGKQLLLLTDQAIEGVPDWFLDNLGESIKIISLAQIISQFERSYLLRRISSFCETVILYHHPYDVVPVMAFSCDAGPPVLLENHAHSWFWLGASVADLVFSHSPFHHNFTLKTRPVKNAYLLPCTQIDDLEDTVTREEKMIAKSRLGLGKDTVCIITIGTPEKFIPNAKYNFFKTAKRIVERFGNVRLFAIGVSEDPILRSKHELHTEKIQFVGPVSDPSPYYKAADICLDAIPQPSLGGTWFSTLIGMSCPLYKYGAGNIFNSRNFTDVKLYAEHIGDLENEEEWLDKIEFLINNPDLRIAIAREFREHYLRNHSQQVIVRNINKMLDFVGKLRHTAGRIPHGIFHKDADSAEIAAASSLQRLTEVMVYFAAYLGFRDKIAILLRIAVRFICWGEILQIVWKSSRSRVKSLPVVLSGWRRLLWPV